MPIRIAMIPITTSSSTSVKPAGLGTGAGREEGWDDRTHRMSHRWCVDDARPDRVASSAGEDVKPPPVRKGRNRFVRRRPRVRRVAVTLLRRGGRVKQKCETNPAQDDRIFTPWQATAPRADSSAPARTKESGAELALATGVRAMASLQLRGTPHLT
jgi:hypothetical protein